MPAAYLRSTPPELICTWRPKTLTPSPLSLAHQHKQKS